MSYHQSADMLHQRDAEILRLLDILLHSAAEPMNDLFLELDRLGVFFGDGSYVVTQFSLDMESVLEKKSFRGACLDELLTLVNKQLSRERIAYTMLSSGTVVSVIYYPRANHETFARQGTVLQGIVDDCEQVCQTIYESEGIRLFSVVSKLYTGAISIPLAFWNSKDMMDYCCFSKHHDVVCEAFWETNKKAFAAAMTEDDKFAEELLSLLHSFTAPEECAEITMQYLQEKCFPFWGYFCQRLQNISSCLWHRLQQNRNGEHAPEAALMDPYISPHSTTWRFLTNLLTQQFSQFAAADTVQSEHEQKMHEILDYIHTHYSDNTLSVSGLAQHFKLSQSYLSTHFKRITGENLSNYIHQVRIGAAKERILSSKDSILQIAEEVGYTNASTFYRVFKRLEGTSPNNLRN